MRSGSRSDQKAVNTPSEQLFHGRDKIRIDSGRDGSGVIGCNVGDLEVDAEVLRASNSMSAAMLLAFITPMRPTPTRTRMIFFMLFPCCYNRC